MTATRPEPTLLRALARAVSAEQRRLQSLRGTWWILLATAVVMLGLAVLFGLDVRNEVSREEPWPPAHRAGELALMPGQLGLLLLAMLAVTSEYATRQVTTSLQWTPRRGLLFLARTSYVVAVATLIGVLLVVTADLITWFLAAPVLTLTIGGLASSVGTASAILALGSALAVGVAFLLRSTAATLSTVVLLVVVLPLLLPAFEIAWLRTVAAHLPGGASATLLAEESSGTTPAAAWIALTSWTSFSLALGAASLLNRDSD